MHKKIIPFLLTFFLIFSSIPVSAYDAADEAKVVRAIKQREVSIRNVSASTQDLIGVNYSATSYRASETVSAPEGRSGIFFYSCLTG